MEFRLKNLPSEVLRKRGKTKVNCNKFRVQNVLLYRHFGLKSAESFNQLSWYTYTIHGTGWTWLFYHV